MIRKIATYTAIILGVFALALIIWQFRSAVLLFVFSLIAAASVRPMIDSLVARGMKRGFAIGLVYFSLLIFISGVVYATTVPLLGELQRASDNLALTYERIWVDWPTGTQFQRMIIERLPSPPDLYEAMAGEQGSQAGQAFLGITVTSAGFISQVFAILILSLYWSIDRIYFERLWLSLLPVESRARARDVWRDIEARVGAYVRSEIIQSVLVGILLAAGFRLMGMQYPVSMALIGAVAWLVPWIGAVLAVIPIYLIGSSISQALGIIAVIYTIAVLAFQEIVIEPRIVSRKNFSSLLIVMVMIAMADAFGLIGIFLSPPLAVALQLLVGSLIRPVVPAPEIESIQKIANLDDRLATVHEILASLPEEPSPQAENMLSRLDTLVDRANKLLAEHVGRK